MLFLRSWIFFISSSIFMHFNKIFLMFMDLDIMNVHFSYFSRWRYEYTLSVRVPRVACKQRCLEKYNEQFHQSSNISLEVIIMWYTSVMSAVSLMTKIMCCNFFIQNLTTDDICYSIVFITVDLEWTQINLIFILLLLVIL